MAENFLPIYEALPYLLRGSLVTIGLVGGALSLGLILGIPMAIGQAYGNKYVAGLISFYVWFFRGLPVLVLLFLFYFGLFAVLGLDLSAFTAAILVLGLRSAAYQSQIFRGSIQSLGEGQMLAARSLGCLLYTSDAADEEDSVDLGGRRIITKKKTYKMSLELHEY